ncbi:MAG: nucleoside hydrolase [Candidatus Nealsonbacteria bacterium]|nr:nucleoside hydrolase [Candidatus Nealsonbacteria bacterium]
MKTIRLCAWLFAVGIGVAMASSSSAAGIPVIFDTDIGDDIDDTWALVMLLKSPELDVKLITSTCHASDARGKLLAKLLTIAGRTDVPIGLGPGSDGKTRQDEWTKDFQMDKYPGKVHRDGAQAIIDTIRASREPITVVAVGPLQTLSAALVKDPEIAGKARFVGMHGSVRKGYGGSDKLSAEYNVRRDAAAARRVLSAPWQKTTITPLDTCGIVHLEGDRFATLNKSDDPLVVALMENYAIWAGKKGQAGKLTRSSTLFDTVAIYLAYPGAKELATMETLSIKVTDDGYTRIDPAGTKTSVATSWKSLDGYRDLMVKILTSKTVK